MKLKDKYTIDYIEKNNLCLLKVLVGSYSQNLQTEKSDMDYAGVFIFEEDDYYSLRRNFEGFDTIVSTNPDVTHVEKFYKVVSVNSDMTYMEIGKFMELLSKNNPNALEILASSQIKENVIIKHPYFDELKFEEIISKKCEYTFGKYASDQVKKATGLNKKMNNPIPVKKKTILDFCRYYDEFTDKPLVKYLSDCNFDQKFIGLQAIKNAKSTYRMFIDEHSQRCFKNPNKFRGWEENDITQYKNVRNFAKFKGIIHPDEKEKSNSIRVSSIPKDRDKYDIENVGLIYYNLEGYETYCKDYLEYQEWVKKRNPERHKHNQGQQFDVKNMSHCCRLLTMAKEIAQTGEINVRRESDANFFRDIKLGKIKYETVLDYSLTYADGLKKWYAESNLRNEPNFEYLNDVLILFRKNYKLSQDKPE